jgi:hypothetical protein
MPTAAVLGHQLEHVGTGVQLDGAGLHLARERLVGAEQQLLTGLAPGVEGAADLGATEGAVGEQAAVLASERDPLRGALVDDLVRDLREPVDVRLAGAVVAALHGVVEETEDRVAVAVVVLGGVDPALGGDRVRTARRVVEGEDLHLVAQLTHRGGGRGPGQAGPDDDHLELALVVRVDQLHRELVVVPHALEGAVGDLRVEQHRVSSLFGPGVRAGQEMIPTWTAMGNERLPPTTMTANPMAKARRQWLKRRLFQPIDWNRLQPPW